MKNPRFKSKKSLLIMLFTLSIFSLFISPNVEAITYSELGLIPYGPFPYDAFFKDMWGLSVSSDAIYMSDADRLLLSLDKGKNWVSIKNKKSDFDFWAMDPTNSSRVYLYDGYNKKFLRTDNYGKTWKNITPIDPSLGELKGITISKSNSAYIYLYGVTIEDKPKIYLSKDYGNTWILLDFLPPYGKIYRVYVDVADPYRLYIFGFLGIQYGGNEDALYIVNIDPSSVSIKSFISVGLPTEGDLYADDIQYYELRQNPSKPSELWVFKRGYGCLYKSSDRGNNFSPNSQDLCSAYIYEVRVNGSKIAVATKEEVKLSTDGGNNFSYTLISGDIRLMDTVDFNEFYCGKYVYDPVEYLFKYRFIYFNGTEKPSGKVSILSLTADRSYISDSKRTYKLNNKGEYETFIFTGFSNLEKLQNGYLLGKEYSNDTCYRISPTRVANSIPCYDFYISDISKDYFYIIDQDSIKKLKVSDGSFVKTITQSGEKIAVSTDERRIVISNSNIIYVSDNGGNSFRQTVLNDFNGINDIIIDKDNSSKIFIAGGSGLYYSVDGGITFSQIFSEKFIKIRQTNTDQFLAITEGNIYETTDGGSTWKLIKNPFIYSYYILNDMTKINNNYSIATNYGVVDILPNSGALVKVLIPNGGEKFKAGSTYSIKWEAPLNAYKFNLSFSTDNKTSWNNITTVLASSRCSSDGKKYTCTYNWTIPAQDNRKPSSFVRVQALDGSNQNLGIDTSDKSFVIDVLRVTSPNGGESLTAGSTHKIKWETYSLTKTVSSVVLQYTFNGGTTWTNITTITGTNPGEFDWIIPNISSVNCKVRVILRDSTGTVITSDVSDKAFTIQQ